MFLQDNVDGMRKYPDKYFDIAIVDPPYGIGQNWKKDRTAKFYRHNNDFNNSVPGAEYFAQLFRVSKHQVIWGCNYYWNYLPPTNHLIFWDKGKDAETQNGSAGELAWTDITKYALIKCYLPWNGVIKCEDAIRIHPHQKPVKLYEWIMGRFCDPGWHILDTHVGSGSSRIAALNKEINFTGFENCMQYFIAQENRYKNHRIQCQMNLI